MRSMMRKAATFLTVILFVISWNIFFIKGDAFPYENFTRADCTVFYLDRPLFMNLPAYYVTGRIFLPFEEFIIAAGGTFYPLNDEGLYAMLNDRKIDIFSDDDEALAYPLHYENDAPYISLYDICNIFSLAAVFSSQENKVSLYKRTMPIARIKDYSSASPAYLRLEDISADGIINPKFHENMEKIRVMADYLFTKGQEFHVAWIPLYTNPPLNVQNDLTKSFTLYNADFLYTLDYITQRGGHIAIHGYTHQHGDSISGEGDEFGPGVPFTLEDVEDRIRAVVDYAERLGFESRIFVTPHYNYTPEQQRIIEKYFDVIYQQSFYRNCPGQIDTVNRLGRTIKYVPTPVGYVTSLEEISATLDKIESLPEDQVMSMFVHPIVEYRSISCFTDSQKTRHFVYNENGVLPQIIRKITEKNYVFSAIE